MQTQSLSAPALREFASVLPAWDEIKKDTVEHPLTLESGAVPSLYRAGDGWRVDYRQGMSLLVFFSGKAGESAQYFYLDRGVELKSGVLFTLLPMREKSEVSLFLPEGEAFAAAGTADLPQLGAAAPVLRVAEICTCFYQEGARDFYFRGERHEPYELTYVDRGQLHNVVNGQDICLAQRSLVIFGSDDWHIQFSDVPVSFFTVSFRTASPLPETLLNRALTLSASGAAAVASMLRERENGRTGWGEMLEAQLQILLIELIRAGESEERPAGRSIPLPSTLHAENAIADAAVQLISGNINRRLTLAEVAGAVHVSVPYLCRVFTNSIGMSPGRFITRIRLEECKTLLRAGELSMGEIAEKLGFSSAQLFSRQFRRCFGLSPSEYVKSLR